MVYFISIVHNTATELSWLVQIELVLYITEFEQVLAQSPKGLSVGFPIEIKPIKYSKQDGANRRFSFRGTDFIYHLTLHLFEGGIY